MQDDDHSTDLFRQYDSIETDRQTRDELYRIFMTDDVEFINAHLRGILEILDDYEDLTPRTMANLRRILEESNRVAKHAVVLFGLFQEQAFVDYFLNAEGAPKVPPQKLIAFIQDSLVPKTNALLNGRITSCNEFVNQCRYDYVTT